MEGEECLYHRCCQNKSTNRYRAAVAFLNRKSTGTASCFHEANVSRRHTKDVTTKYHEQITDGPEGSQSFDPETGIPDYQMTMQRFQAKRYDESIEKPSMKE